MQNGFKGDKGTHAKQIRIEWEGLRNSEDTLTDK